MNTFLEDLYEGAGSNLRATRLMCKAGNEIKRLQKIIDSRPAINAGLPETYIKWSQSIYSMEFNHAVSVNNN